MTTNDNYIEYDKVLWQVVSEAFAYLDWPHIIENKQNY